MKKFLRKSLIYLIMTVLALPVSAITGYSRVERAKAGDVSIINEGFDNGFVAPDGWQFSNINEIYTTSSNYGLESPSLKLGNIDEVQSQITTKEFENPSKLAFWIKGLSTDHVSSLIIEGWQDDVWVPVAILNPIPTTGTPENYDLNSGIRKIRFTYYKSEGNIALDDVVIQQTDINQPTVVSSFDKSYVISKYDLGHEVNIPIEYSEPMDQNVKPAIMFYENNELFNQVLDCEGNWTDEKTYNYHCRVSDGSDSQLEIPASTATISGAQDLAGNIQVPFTTDATLAVDLVLPVVEITFPTEGAKVNGTEKIEYSASEEIITACAVSLIGEEPGLDRWFGCQSDITRINKLPGFNGLPDGQFTLHFEAIDYNGNDPVLTINLIKDTVSPTATINYSTTNPTNSSVLATLIPNEPIVVTNTEGGSLDYTFNENGTFTFEFIDLAGNSGTATATIENINKDIIPSPQIKTPVLVSGKTINLEWNEVKGAVGYNVYLSNKQKGLATRESIKSNSTDLVKELKYNINVLEYGDYYVVATAVDQYGNESLISHIAAEQLLVNVPAPVVKPVTIIPTESPSEAQPVANPVTPQKAKAAVNPEPAPEQTVETPKDDSGVIKGDEKKDEKTETNWTPWIILFILVILAGAATGGYFYWFAGKEGENEPEATKKKEIKEKVSVTVREQKKPDKKSKRW